MSSGTWPRDGVITCHSCLEALNLFRQSAIKLFDFKSLFDFFCQYFCIWGVIINILVSFPQNFSL